MKCHTWVRTGLAAVGLTAVLTFGVGAGAASFGTGVVNADALHLRSGASTATSSLGLVRNGVEVEVLEDAVDGWYKVSYNGKTGYMSADYLVVTPVLGEDGGVEAEVSVPTEENSGAIAEDPVPLAETPEEEPESLGFGRVVLNSGTLNLRAEPSKESARRTSIPNGAILTLEGSVDGWYLVTYRNVSGYVSADYIELTDEEPAALAENPMGADIVALAKQYLGCPYVYGAAGPKSFDCSGFTSFIYKQFGYSLTRSASSQCNNDGVSVARVDLQPGDLVFFRDYSCTKSASHVGMYIGDGQFIHASSSRSGSGVKISSLSETWYANRYVGGKRILA